MIFLLFQPGCLMEYYVHSLIDDNTLIVDITVGHWRSFRILITCFDCIMTTYAANLKSYANINVASQSRLQLCHVNSAGNYTGYIPVFLSNFFFFDIKERKMNANGLTVHGINTYIH